MRRHVLLSFGLLLVVFWGCSDLSGPGIDSDSTEAAAGIFGPSAALSLEKTTNGQDADDAPGPSVAPGEFVIWEYQVTNTGAEAVTDLVVMDDTEGLVCTIAVLAVGEIGVCSLEGEAQAGPYANLGTVSGRVPTSPFPVEAGDWSHYLGEVVEGRQPTEGVVGILIKPGDEAPCMNPRSKGRTPVAILGSFEFDALGVDPRTILAGGSVAPIRWGKGEDVNGDGMLDLVIHFKTQELKAAGLLQDGVELIISGQTFDGAEFTGSDLIRLVKGPFCK